MKPFKFLMVTGETSGDMYGAEVARAPGKGSTSRIARHGCHPCACNPKPCIALRRQWTCDRRPLDVLAAGDLAAVMAAVQATRTGAYA